MEKNITELLNQNGIGEVGAQSRLLDAVYAELRMLANSQMRRCSDAHTLQPTALVHEAYMKMVRVEDSGWASRRHFYALASRVMRTVLVDHARGKSALKRGGPATALTLDDQIPAPKSPAETVDLFDFGLALEDLSELNPELATVAELRYLGGLSVTEVAETIEVSVRTAERRLNVANAWLRDRFSGE